MNAESKWTRTHEAEFDVDCEKFHLDSDNSEIQAAWLAARLRSEEEVKALKSDGGKYAYELAADAIKDAVKEERNVIETLEAVTKVELAQAGDQNDQQYYEGAEWAFRRVLDNLAEIRRIREEASQRISGATKP